MSSTSVPEHELHGVRADSNLSLRSQNAIKKQPDYGNGTAAGRAAMYDATAATKAPGHIWRHVAELEDVEM